jgi:autotransporter-associated beta strand protein
MKSTKTSRFSKPSHILVGSIAACAVLGLASSASAQTHNWKAAGPTLLWNNPLNWFEGTVPGAGNTVRFELGTLDPGTTPASPIVMNVNYNDVGLGGVGALGFVRFTGNEDVSIENYLKVTNTTTALQLANGSGGAAGIVVPSTGTINGTINFGNEAGRTHPVLNFTGGNWVAGNVKTESSNRQGGILKVSSSTGTLTPGAVLVSLAPELVASRATFSFALDAAGVAPIAFTHATDPLQLTGAAAGTNPFKLNVEAALYAGAYGGGGGLDVPLITHTNDADRLFSAGNITIANVPAGKGAFVTQHNTGTTLTLTNAVDWSGATLDTLWATAGNWGGTVPGATLDNTIANFPTGVTPVVADLVATSRTLAVLNINTGTLAASNYSITSTGGGTINLGAMPTDSAQMAAQINVLKGTSNTISAPVALSMNGQVNTAASTSLNMSGAISGSGFSLTKVGAGTLVLSGGANSYTGATIIEEGILSVSNLANAGANSDLGNYPTAGAAGIVIKGGTLKYTGGTMGTAIDRGITLTASSTVDLPIAGDMRIGSLALASAAAMDLIVTGNGVAASRLYIDSVTVPTSTGNRVGPVFKPNTASLTIGSITGNGNFQMQGAAGASDNIINGPINLGKGNTTLNQEQIFGPIAANTWTIMSENTFDGRWYAAAGIVKIKSPGSLVLGQNVSYAFGQVADTAMNWPGVNETATKFYNGNTDVQLLNDLSTSYQYKPGARVSVRAAAAVKFTVGPIGAATNQTHNLGNMWIHDNGTTVTVDAVGASGYGLTFDDVYFRDTGAGHTMNFAGNAALTLASAIKANGANTMNANFNRTGATTISGGFGQGTGVLNLSKQNTGTLTLNGAGTHIGTTTVSGGKIVMGHAQALQYSAYNTAGSNGSTIGVDANGSATVTLGGLTGNVNLTAAMVGYTTSVTGLTLQPQSGTVTYTGVIADGSAATTLTKAGGGTQILNNANTYAGGTNVNGGTLRLDGAFNMPAIGTLQVNGGGNFSLADGTRRATSTAALSLASGANLTFDWVTADVDTLTSTAAATTVAGPVGININPLSSPDSTGITTLIDSPSGGLNTATYYLANNTNFTATLSQSATAVTIGSYAAVTAPTLLFWQGNKVAAANTALVDNALALSTGTASNWSTTQGSYTATGVVPGSTADVIFSTTDTPTEQSTVMGANMTVKSVTFHDANAAVTIGGNNTLTLTSTATGAGSGTGAGGSAITVTSAANATNTISANILVGAGQTWNVATGKTLTVSGAISGNFDIIKNSPGTLVLSGNNTAHTGTMTITAGIVRGGTNAATSSGNLNFNGGVLEGSGTFTRGLGQMAGLVQWTGTGGFAAFGAPLTVTLGGPSGVDWALSNAAGGLNGQNLLFGSATSDNVVTLTNNLNMKGNRTVTVNDNNLSAADHTVFSGVLADGDTTARNFTKAGLGTLVLSGGNTYSGTTTVSAGTLAAAHATALGTTGANTSVSNGATLDVRATVAEPISITGTGVGGAGALITATANTGTVGGTVTLTGATSIGGAGTGILNINGIVAAGANTLTTLGTGETTFGAASTLTSVASLAVTDGTTNVNSALGTAGNTAVNVSDLGNGTKLRFGSVSQTLSSLTIGAGATVVFTSGLASGSLTGDDGGGKAAGFGSPASSFGGGATVPEPGTLGLLLVGALGMLNRRRRQA